MSRRRRVLCFGDSNTHGSRAMADPGDVSRYDGKTRWPRVAAAELGAGWSLIEEGQPGRTTVHDDPVEGAHKNGLRVLPALLESHRPVDLVAVMLGTNDLKARFALEPIDIAFSLRRLLRAIAASDCGPGGRAPAALVIAPVPVEETGWLGEMFAGGAAKSRALAPRFRAVAEAEGAAFLDAGAVATVDPRDGIHLDDAAHRAIGRAVAAALREALAAAPAAGPE